MQINHHFTQEILIPSTGEFEEVTVHVICDCNEIRRQPDVGIFSDYLELEEVTIDSIYFGGDIIIDPKVIKLIEAFIKADFDNIQTQINEDN